MPLSTLPFGPFTKGVIDAANPSIDLTGALRSLRNGVYTGAMQLAARAGTSAVLTLYDDAGTPAPVTNVIAVQAFADGALAIAYSSVTQKCYLYKLAASMDSWYDAAGVLQSDTNPRPQGVLWSSMTEVPDVTIAEGLGVAYIAHASPADASGLYWPTKTYTNTSRAIASLTANLDGAGAAPVYFSSVISFQLHLWGAGFGAGAAAASGYRPELARFSQPNFGTLQAADSLTLGDRVRSERERIVGLGVAGNALFLGAPYLLSRVTGFGRASWFRTQIDHVHGFAGPKCMAAAGHRLYYWSPGAGPLRVGENDAPELLGGPIEALIRRVVNPATTVAMYDAARHLVIFTVDVGNSVRTWCAYDTVRELWIGPDNDWGLPIRCAGQVDAIVRSTAAAPGGTYPVAAPTSPVTSGVGASTATADWTPGDATAQTKVWLERLDLGTLDLVTTLPTGVNSYTFTGLTSLKDYQWAVTHTKSGQDSPTLGPDASTAFTTTANARVAPTNLALRSTFKGLRVSWTNSGESGVDYEVQLAGPLATTPTEDDYAPSTLVTGGASSCLITIPEDGTYWVRVRATSAGGVSDWLGPLSADCIAS